MASIEKLIRMKYQGENMDILVQLEKWFKIHCDDDWEHDERITIYNIDNPGWNVHISLEGTLLEETEFKRIKFGDPEDRENKWLDCFKQGGIYIGLGSWDMLERIIMEFLVWADNNTDTSPWNDKVDELFRRCAECEERICENIENNSESIHELRDIFRKIDDIPNEHKKKRELFDRFYSVWNKIVW